MLLLLPALIHEVDQFHALPIWFVCVKVPIVTTMIDRPEAGSFDARRDSVVATAAALFRQQGFNGVGIDDIGAAVGLTGPAIFHYFPNKQALLAAIADHLLSRLQAALVAPGREPAGVLTRVVSTAVAAPDALAVSMRHLGHLDSDVLAPIENRMRSIAVDVCRLGTRRDRVHLRLRAVGGALVALGLARKPPGVDLDSLAVNIVRAILAAPLPHRELASTRPPRDDIRSRAARAFRREAILAAAARLFHERGFNGVSLDDIGATVGITGSAISRRFGNKERLLTAAFNRLGDQLSAALYEALSNIDDPAAGVEQMMRCYAEVAARSRRLICLNLSETHRLPPADRAARRKRQHAYIDELAFLLTETQPDLPMPEARLRARVALVVISEVLNSDDLAGRESLVEDLTTLTMAVVQRQGVAA